VKLHFPKTFYLPPIKDWAAIAGVLVLIGFHLQEAIPFQSTIRNYAFDLYQSAMPRERISSPVAIIDIDEDSLKQYGQWPWPRSLVAQLIEKVGVMKPASIALDIIMPEDDRSSPCNITQFIPNIDPETRAKICELPTNDELLAKKLKQYKAILGVAGIEGDANITLRAPPLLISGSNPKPWMKNFSSALTNIDLLDRAAAGHAILSTEVENGVIRRVPMVASIGETVMPSLSLESLRLATGSATIKTFSSDRGIEGVGVSDLIIPTQPDGSLYVHFSLHDPSRFISAASILEGTVNPDNIAQKLVLIGFSGLGLVDFPTTAIGDRVPGVEIHAQIMETIFDGTTLLRPHWALWLEASIILFIGLAVIYLLPRLNTHYQVIVVSFSVTIILAMGFIAFLTARLLIDIASPIILFIALYIAMLADSLIRDEGQIKELEQNLRIEREEAAKVQGEMEAAKRFQMGILPQSETSFTDEKRFDIAAIMEPAKMVGGDLYDFFMLDETHMFFSLGDVCGKGVPASLFMVISKTLCKSIALREDADYGQLGQIISQANREIARDNPEMLFVTAFIGIINLNTGELTYCNAGHERPFLVSANNKPKELAQASGPPIAIMDNIEYKTFTYKLSSEEFICVFTDGITEALNNEDELFGTHRVLAALDDIKSSDNAESVLKKLCDQVHTFVGDTEPSDDLTMLVVRWHGNN